jgi:uncharacterized protein YbaR (Trm112 family)
MIGCRLNKDVENEAVITRLPLSVDLLSCPFCDGEGELAVLEDENVPELEPLYFVICKDCDAHGSCRGNPFNAEKWWNREMVEIAKADRREHEALG